MKVLMACDSYVPGTNFPAWVHRIMVNQFITNVRRQREYSALDQMRWTPPVGQFGGLDKLGSGCRQAASLSISGAQYASSGERPASVE
jgi:DNA-directed RNA polymerase specialized sigma24 family protein